MNAVRNRLLSLIDAGRLWLRPMCVRDNAPLLGNKKEGAHTLFFMLFFSIKSWKNADEFGVFRFNPFYTAAAIT